jgi:hypothetical protein
VEDADYVWSGQTAGLAEAPSLQVVVELLTENGQVQSKSAMSVIKFAERRAFAPGTEKAVSNPEEKLLMGGRRLMDGRRLKVEGARSPTFGGLRRGDLSRKRTTKRQRERQPDQECCCYDSAC